MTESFGSALDKSYVARAEALIPGCCVASMYLPPGMRVVIARAEGAMLYDETGKEYIDFVLGSGPMILGHAHPEVIEAVTDQLRNGSTYFAINTRAVELAERLVEAAPCGEAVRFQTTGSDATFAAMRLARAATGRFKIVVFEGAYHGGHDIGQLAGTGGSPPNYLWPVATSSGLTQSAREDVLVAPFNDFETTGAILERHRADVAGVIVEPLHRVFPPRDHFLEQLRDLTSRLGIVLIFDEVVTGFRLAWGGGQERYGVVPDLACYGKALGGGFPLAAVVGRRDLLDYADPGKRLDEGFCFLGGTLTGNPAACAAGLATLKVLREPGVYDRLYELARRLRAGLLAAAQRHGQTVQVLGEGPVLQVVFLNGPEPINHRGLQGADKAKALAFSLSLIERGTFVNPGGKFYLSLAHNEDIIDAAVRRADAAFASLH